MNQHFSVETTSVIKENLTSLKTKNNEYLQLMHEQMQFISNIISDKYVENFMHDNNIIYPFSFIKLWFCFLLQIF